MPRIKLLQPRGEYVWNKKLFEAGREYDVDDMVANYLIVHSKVAVEVGGDKGYVDYTSTLPPKTEQVIAPSKSRLKVALIRLGGIGDSLLLTIMSTAIKKKYPDAHTTLFVRDRGGYDIVNNHPSVDRVVIVGNLYWIDFTKSIIAKDFDIVCDCRYVTKMYYKNLTKFGKDQAEADKCFKPYQELYDNFPRSIHKVCNKHGGSEIDFTLETANLQGSVDDLKLHLSRSDFNMLPLIDTEEYITIHNGADVSRQTKCWVTSYWIKVVAYLKEKGYKVIQLGGRFEEYVEGAIDMTSKTSLTQASAIISKAKFHIDTEGGLVHIARAVNTRSIVMFAPTPVSFFGYDCNINIASPVDCIGCWWTTDFWWRECPKKYELPAKCMKKLTPKMIEDAIDKMEKLKPLNKKIDMNDINEQFAIELVLDEAHYKSEQHQWDRIYTMMGKVRGKKVLEVGAGDGYCVEVLKKQGFDVSATEVSQIRLKRMKDKGIDAVYGDINKLPFEDNSYDTVICGEVLEHIDSIGKGFSELERVCKPDGIIIISLPVADRYREIKMHKWGVSHHIIRYHGQEDLVVMGFERIR